MKKVGKEFRKSLSAILAAAMVVSSMPETSLVANAEGVETQQTYELDESSIVDNGESLDATIALNAVDSNGNPVAGVTVKATTIKHNADSDLVFIQDVTLGGDKGALYDVVTVGGERISTVDDEEAYRIEDQESAPGSLNVEVERNEKVSITFNSADDKFTYDSGNQSSYDITSGTDYTFGITPDTNYDLTVKATKANGDTVAVSSATGDDGKIVYTIAKSALAASDDITISVTAKKTKWSLTLPTLTDSDSLSTSATYKINSGAEKAIDTGATLDNLAKNDKVTVTITTAKPTDATKEVTYIVDGEKKTAKETKGDTDYTYTFDITNTWTTNATPKDIVVSDIILKQTNLQTVTVAFQDKDGNAKTSGVSAKIAAIDIVDDKEKVGTFNAVDLTSGVKVPEGNYYLQLNNGGKTLDYVGTGATPESDKIYPTTLDGVGDVYKITVPSDGLAITAKDAAEDVTVTLKNNENIKEVWYSTSTSTFDSETKAGYTKVVGSSFKVVKDAANVYIYPVANDTYEVTKSKVGTAEENTFTDGSVLTVSGVSAATDVTFKATRKEATYTFTANPNAKIIVNVDKVKKMDGTALTNEQKESDIEISTGSKTITVNEGDVLEFKVEPKTGFKNAKASLNSSNTEGGTVVEKTGDTYPFQIKADKAAATTNGYVYVEVVGINEAAVATFKAATIDRTSNVSATSQIDKVSVKQPNDSQGKPVDDKDIAYSSTWQDTGLTEGKSYSFKVTPATGFEVTKVTWNKDGESDKAQTLTASGDYYTISSLPAEDIEIEITTQIKKSEANTITFNFDESKVASVVIDAPVADTTEGAWSIKNGTTVYTTESSISYTVTAKNGYKVTKVNDADETSAAESKSGSKIFTSTDKSATVNITADADAATEKKFIKIKNPADAAASGFSFELADSTVVEKETNYTIYEIAPTVKEAEFTITLDYGKKVTGITYGAGSDAVGNRINSDLNTSSADKKTSTIKGKIVVNQIVTGTSKNSPEVYSFTIGEDKKDVKFFGTYEPEVLTNHSFVADTATPIMLGEKVIFKIPEGAKLFSVDKDGKNPKELALDAYGKYTFTVEKDTYFNIDYVVAKADYKVLADTDSTLDDTTFVEDSTKDANTFNFDYTVGKVYLGIDTTSLTGHTIKIKKATVASGFESTAKVDATNSCVEVAVSKKDADKDVKVSLDITDVNADGDVKTATVEATLHLSATLTGIVLKDGTDDKANTISTGETLDFVPNATYEFPIAEALPSSFIFENGLTLEDYTTISVKTAEGTAATKATITGTRGNEILTIITPAKDEKATITISNAIEKTEIFTLTANTVAPNYKISKVESPSQSFNSINLTITPDKKIIASPSNMYYEVVVNSTGDTTPAGSLSNKAYYIPVDIDDDGYAAVTSANIKVNTAKADEAAGTYSFAVRMVLTASEVNGETTAITPLADSQVVKASAVVTKTFATRNAYYEDKLGLTKKSTTIYNNGDKKVMAVAKYSKNASYFGDVQGYVLNSNEVEDYVHFNVGADQTTGEVYVETIGDVQPGKYTLVVQATGTDTGAGEKAIYRASAKMNFTVNQSIYSITETNKKIKYNAKKNTSLTLSPVIEGNSYTVDGKLKYYANKSKAVTYEIEVPARVQGAARANILNNVSVNSKGKITVSKNFVVGSDSADNTFNVRIKANDFEKNREDCLISVEVTTENVVPAEVFLGKWNRAAQRYDKLGTTLTVEDLAGAELVALDATGKNVSDYVTFTSSSSSVKVDKKLGSLDFAKIKPGKNIVFTATTTDGGKKKVKSVKYTIAYTKATNLTLSFWNSDENVYASNYNRLVEVSENNYQYFATNTPRFGFDVIDIIDPNDRSKDVDAYTSYYSYTLSINGGKIEYGNTKQYGYVYPTAETTTITLKDKTNNKTKKITLKNTNWQTTKAPKTKLVDGKAYFSLYSTLEYSVAGDYEAVYISRSAGSKRNAWLDGTEGCVGISKPIVDGTFKFVVFGNKVGTEKFTVVFGKYDADGVTFIPQTKASTLSVKVNGIANFKPATKYTYNPYDSKLIELTGTPKDVYPYWSDLANANIGGKPNNFLKYFELETVTDPVTGNTYTTGKLKATADLTEKALTDGIDAKDLTGYVSYSYTNAKGNWVKKDTKITVVLENATKAYTASTITMLNTAGSTGTGLVSLNETGMTLAKVQAVDTANWKVDTYTSYDLDDNLVKNIKLTALKAQTAGTTTVDVYVLPANSQYADKTDLKKYGTLVSIPVVIGDAAAFTGKVSVEKLIDLNKTAAFDVATAYSSKKLSGYWTAKAKANDVYKYTIDCGKIASATVSGDAATGFAAELKNDGNGDYIQFSVYRSALELGKVYEVPVDVTFADGSAAETVMFDIAVPAKAQSMDDIAADIKKALEETAYDSTKSADMFYVTDAVNTVVIDPISCVNAPTVAWESVEETQADGTKKEVSKKVTVTLTDKRDVNTKKEIVVTLPKKVSKKLTKSEIDTALAAYVGRIVQKSEYDALTEDQKKANEYLVTSNDTTRFTIRQYLEKALGENSDYMLSITNFKIEKAEDKSEDYPTGKAGKLSFTYCLVDKYQRYTPVNSGDKAITTLYVAPTTPVAP